MTEWKVGLVIAPIMIVAMTLLLFHKRAISRSTVWLVLSVVTAITAVLFST